MQVHWNFDYDYARNVIIFGIDSSSSSHAENRKNSFLVLGVGPTFGINGSFGSAEKKSLILILVKQTQNFTVVYIIMLIIAICLLMEKKYLS